MPNIALSAPTRADHQLSHLGDADGLGYPDTPGIWSFEQVQGWRKVTDAVHAKGGKIVLQLWHVGRICDPIYLDGQLPAAPSAIKPAGHVSLVRPMKDYETPRALETGEIAGIVEAYRKGAKMPKRPVSMASRFTGPTVTCSTSSCRTALTSAPRQYGGSLNRARLMLEVTDAAIGIWGAGRVGVHLAPRADSHNMGDSNREVTFGYVVRELGKRGVAFICARQKVGVGSLGP